MTQFASDSFANSAGTALSTHNSSWVQHSAASAVLVITDANSLRKETAAGTALYYYNAAPGTADYSASADLIFKTANGGDGGVGVCVRMNSSANTFYYLRYFGSTTDAWQLYRFVAGTATLLESYAQAVADESVVNVRLEATGSNPTVLKCFLDDVHITDLDHSDSSPITDAGFAGVRFSNTAATDSNTANLHIDSFSADTIAASSAITFSGLVPTLSGQSGAAFSQDLSTYFSGSETPFSYSLQSGTLHTGLSLNSSTGVISGTPSVAGGRSGFVVRGTDQTPDTDDTNSFGIDIAAATLWTESDLIQNHAFGGPPKCAFMQNGRLFFSTIGDSDNAVQVHRLLGSTLTSTTLRTNASNDIHGGAGIHVDADGYVYAVCTPHGSSADIAVYKSNAPYGTAYTLLSSKTPGGAAYYPWLLEFSGLLFMFANIGANRDINYCTSSDGGATWSAWTVLFQAPSGGRPYFNLSIVGSDLVLVTTAYNTSDVSYGLNHAYFAKFDGSVWSDAGGTTYTLPITTGTAQKCFDATGTSSNFGFFAQCSKDGSGRFVIHGPAYTTATATRAYMLRYASGSWSQTQITHPIATAFDGAIVSDPDDSYRFFSLADYGGVIQWCISESADDGATWNHTRITSGSLTRERGAARKIYGTPITDKFVLYGDETRVSNTDWTMDIVAPFNDSGAINATSVTLTLTTDGSTPAASLSSLKWAFFDEATPDGFTAPAAQGAVESTDGSGVLVLDITGSTLYDGDTGWLIVTDSDGTTTQSPAHKAFSGPVVVA